MAFIITKDNVASEEDKVENPEGGGNLYAVGLTGPASVSPAIEARLRNNEGAHFRMRYDEPLDEEKPAYYGYYLEDPEDEGEWDEFQPLDCFGEGNAGCAMIEYKNDKGEWEIL